MHKIDVSSFPGPLKSARRLDGTVQIYQNREISTLRRKLSGPYFYNSDVIMRAIASQITGVSIVCSTVCSGADQRKHQSSASLAFVRGIHQWPVDSLTKGQWRGKCFHLIASPCCVPQFKWKQNLSELKYLYFISRTQLLLPLHKSIDFQQPRQSKLHAV